MDKCADIKFDIFGINNIQPIWADQYFKNISNSAKSRARTKRGKYTDKAVRNIRNAKLKNVEKPFICHQNQKIYKNKVEAAEDLGIKPGGISAVLSETTRNKSIHGYTFEYLQET